MGNDLMTAGAYGGNFGLGGNSFNPRGSRIMRYGVGNVDPSLYNNRV